MAVAAPAGAQAPVAPAAAGRAAVEEAVLVVAAFRLRVAEGVSRARMKVASARSPKCLGIFQRECRTRPAQRLSTSTEALSTGRSSTTQLPLQSETGRGEIARKITPARPCGRESKHTNASR